MDLLTKYFNLTLFSFCFWRTKQCHMWLARKSLSSMCMYYPPSSKFNLTNTGVSLSPSRSVMQLTGWDKAKITIIILPGACHTMKSFPTFHPKYNNGALVTCGYRYMNGRPHVCGTFLILMWDLCSAEAFELFSLSEAEKLEGNQNIIFDHHVLLNNQYIYILLAQPYI